MRDMKEEAAEVVATLAARGIGIEILEACAGEQGSEDWRLELRRYRSVQVAVHLWIIGKPCEVWTVYAPRSPYAAGPVGMTMPRRAGLNPVLQMFGECESAFLAWMRGSPRCDVAFFRDEPRETGSYEGDGRRDGDDDMYVDAVGRMADAMLAKLRRHADKGGWNGMAHLELAGRLNDEVGELLGAIVSGDSPEHVLEEAADVANFAMMLADNYGKDRR